MGAGAEVTDSLTSISGSTEKESVGASGGAHGELVKGDGLTALGKDSGK